MTESTKIAFTDLKPADGGVLVVLTDEELGFGPVTKRALAPAGDLVARAAKTEGFKGKAGKMLEIVAPAGLKAERLIVVGTGRRKDRKATAFLKGGGAVMGKVPASAKTVTALLELSDGKVSGRDAADFALGMRLRAYKFDRYKTKRKEGEDKDKDAPVKAAVTIATSDVAGARAAWATSSGIAEGVLIARDLINEPPNVLYPIEFARRASSLKKLGVAVEVLDIKAMTKLGMGAILGVGQGSPQESRVVIMRWNGGKKNEPPVAFIGKGVCFDTGGISIKPAASMEDMKGDMAGAACVVGLMHALAARKARVNVVGAIGLTENMPSGHAQRPGDIVKSMSGQTIEVINTDAEGRLVLADVVTLVKDRYQPKFMIDLATLTGAILVALGHEYAGLFSNDDKLAKRLIEAGEETGERVWRMPMGPEYDKMIDSKFADMKNVGNGRHAGATAGAQFIARYVDKTPWAHLDIAGTGMGVSPSEINTSWGPGWGVRLLDRLVEEHYEK
jgi:leucyl aminopeptidase